VSVSECAAALVTMVCVLDITLTRVLHEGGGAVMGCWREEQVYMIHHKAPGMYTAVIFGGQLYQVRSGRRDSRPVAP
jgi:hypothetical protein